MCFSWECDRTDFASWLTHCLILFPLTCLLFNAYIQGNYGKAEEVVTKVHKKGEKGEGREEKQPLLDLGSDSETDVEVLGPVLAPLNKSVTKSQKPETMEYDR